MRAAFLALLLSGCTAHINKCKDKTLFVTVALDETAKSADQILVDLSVDGGMQVHGTLAHQPGQAMGGVEVQFPKGYPAGHTIAVSLTATLAGATVGSGSASVQLAGGCDALSLQVGSNQTLGDSAGSDGAPPDFSSLPDGFDLAQRQTDGAPPPDLFGADLTGCSPTENCFNNLDDDCDGLIDCADPDCTAAFAPVAACVPDPGSFTAGVTAAICPTAWPSPAAIHSNLNAGTCANGSCSCTASGSCWSDINDYGSTSTCTGANVEMDNPDTVRGCTGGWNLASGHFFKLVYHGYAGGCGKGVTDAATKMPPTWGATEQFCSGGSVGGGCGLGSICVPAGPNHCVIKPGAQLACPANYVLRTTHYYTGFDDSPRSCGCTCSTLSGGACSGTATATLYNAQGCGVSLTTTINDGVCNNLDATNFHYDILNGVSITTQPTCSAPGTNQTGMTALTGEQTVCCTP